MPLPLSVRKRDGRMAAFEPEKISRSLFAATEAMGAPNAFLARELSESILHFLGLETDGDVVTASHLAEVVAKVVRELGYPAIAKVYEENVRPVRSVPTLLASARPAAKLEHAGPFAVMHRAGRESLRSFSLAEVYPRDLASAHRDGLLDLRDLDHPGEALGMVLQPAHSLPLDAWELLETFCAARSAAGAFLAIDGPEYALAGAGGEPEELAARFLAVVDRCAQLTGLRLILNLNSAEPPSWAQPSNRGPLFADASPTLERWRLDRIADALLKQSKEHAIYWHLAERDLEDGVAARLRDGVEAATGHPDLSFVFDRARQAVLLGPGIDRSHPAALGCVAMNLPRLAQQLGGAGASPAVYCKKLQSLARFAKSAGYARQDYLRKQGRSELLNGFLLERATQVIVPLEPIGAAALILGEYAGPDAIVELALAILRTIREALEADDHRAMATRLDWFSSAGQTSDHLSMSGYNFPLRQEIRYGSQLLEAAGGGKLSFRWNQNGPTSVQYGIDLLKLAAKHDVTRLSV